MNDKEQKFSFTEDNILLQITLSIPEPVIQSTNNVFHDLMSCVIEQQIHYRSTKKVFEKMLDNSKIKLLSKDNFHIFEQNSFTNASISQNKCETIASILQFWDTKNIDWHKLTDEEIRAELSNIKGIGKWTIDMILLYTLRRPNVFPFDDYHLKLIMSSLYGLDPKVKLKANMIEISEKWGDQKSLAVLYLLAWKDSKRKL